MTTQLNTGPVKPTEPQMPAELKRTTETNAAFNILLANPRGFCAGVDRAIDIVNRALELFGAPVYVRHEVVHNRHVVEDLSARGAIFVDELHQVPDNQVLIFSAHGVSKAVQAEAKSRPLNVFDATCPLVTKVHMEVIRYAKKGYHCILIGHKGHPEVEGTLGQFDERFGGKIHLVETLADVSKLLINETRERDQTNKLAASPPKKLAYVTQTTLSMDDTAKVIDALRQRFPTIEGPAKDDICYATQNRQDAVKGLAQKVDVLFVVGSVNSSNSNRLRELGERMGAKAYLIDSALDIQPQWIQGVSTLGVTAGASAPEVLVQGVVDFLTSQGGRVSENPGQSETIAFSLPKELRVVDIT